MSDNQDPDPDFAGVEAALERAAKRAREIARETGTAVVYERDGKLVYEYPATKDRPLIIREEPLKDS